MEGVPRHAQLITVTDGHPATLAWIGGVKGHPVTPLASPSSMNSFGVMRIPREVRRRFGR